LRLLDKESLSPTPDRLDRHQPGKFPTQFMALAWSKRWSRDERRFQLQHAQADRTLNQRAQRFGFPNRLAGAATDRKRL